MPTDVMQVLVYLIVGAAVVLYVVLDGFDLGVGILQIFAGKDHDRRIFLNSIGPFWDGNEVWLIAIIGALFVGFTDVYAILLSGFYLLIILMLFGIVLRAVAIEFRSKEESLKWRYFWDAAFWLASVVITFVSGVILGNILMGLPVDKNREVFVSFAYVFHPYPVYIGLFALSLFAMHGNIFLLMKTEGELQERLHRFSKFLVPLFYLLFIGATIWTWIALPRNTSIFTDHWVFFLVPIALVVSMILVPYMIKNRRYGYSFLFSMITIVLLFALCLIGTFPDMIPSTIDYANYTLTVFNASAQKNNVNCNAFNCCHWATTCFSLWIYFIPSLQR